MAASRFPGGSNYARVRKAYRGIKYVESGQTSPVTSFNTRTGAVTLLESDVLTALGLVFASQAGKALAVNGAEDNLEFISVSLAGHTHDDRYYTEGEVDTLLSGYSLTSHNHDADYADINHTHTMSDITDLPTLASGTYTPTLTNVTNVDSSTAFVNQYMRVGNTVTVSGRIEIDPTAAGVASQVRMTLPIASNLGSGAQVGGVAAGSATAQTFAIRPDETNDEALFSGVPSSAATATYFFTFTYRVV